MPPRGADAVNLLIRFAGAVAAVVGVAAPGALAVELDTATAAGDTIAFASAAGAATGDAGRAGSVGAAAAGAEGRNIGIGVRVVRVVIVLSGDLGCCELGSKLVVAVVGIDDVASLAWLDWLGALDLRGRERAALGDISRDAARGALGLCALAGRGRALLGLASWDVKGVERAASGGLDDVRLGGIVRDMVPVDDVLRFCQDSKI